MKLDKKNVKSIRVGDKIVIHSNDLAYYEGKSQAGLKTEILQIKQDKNYWSFQTGLGWTKRFIWCKTFELQRVNIDTAPLESKKAATMYKGVCID